MLKEPTDKFKLEHLQDALLKTLAGQQYSSHTSTSHKKLKGYILSTRVHIILTASSGVAAKLRTGSQPTSSKLTDKIGEQATPTDPGSMRKCYP
jgi:hypothetical protein